MNEQSGRRENGDPISTALLPTLPAIFANWFAARGWTPRPHQLQLVEKARNGRSALLIAPTGAGKTLAGFLPSLIDLEHRRANAPASLHTLYISPLKALAVDVARNLERPAGEMGLPIRIETRTGDTPQAKRQRQKRDPPDILLTTPEQLALLLASREATDLFGGLKRVVLDELHSIVTSKRGDLLALGLARLRHFVPDLEVVGLSATVRDPDELRRWIVPQSPGHPAMADLVIAEGGAAPVLDILETAERLPWAGHTARHAMAELYALIKAHKTTLVFVNTRMQAEFVFQELWRVNEENLAIALHHGSLEVGQRRRVEEAMAAGRLKAVVCTSTLDLGIDWGDVDLVINVGAPKGASRLLQRIGRANHRLDEPSQAILVPTNRFEVLECKAAVDAAKAGEQDTPIARTGALDVLAQHVLGVACGAPFDADALYREIASAEAYAGLDRPTFDDVLAFVATGGYALKTYDRFAKIRQGKDGLWRVANPMVAQAYRLNVGTIVEEALLKVRLSNRGPREPTRMAADKPTPYLPWFMDPKASGPPKRKPGETAARRGFGRVLGEVEEYFAEGLSIGDTFLFAGEILRFEGIQEEDVLVTRAPPGRDPKIPSFAGGKFPLSTHLASRVRSMLADPDSWTGLPGQVADWLRLQRDISRMPPAGDLLVETFPRGNRHYLVCYPFEGRLAHQTLGMLLTRRLERAKLKPMGFVANDYALAVWGVSDMHRAAMDQLFDQDMLGDDLEEWLAESALMKRMFRTCAIISGLIERRAPGKEKTGRQISVSTDLVYDVLRQHEPHHILMRAAWDDARTGLLDLQRLSGMLSRIRGRIIHKRLDRISPLAVPIMLEIGREPVYGEATDSVLAEAADDLIAEAMVGRQDRPDDRESARDDPAG
ncbi:ligase-associated DNA damage response DEXH box helicase [Labrys sp. ZIDIC5]|uniref:ligase-associated DNA damage response DEXH box helicase n=1 Tax=Labrys sedimenti TaxID=3106036 RepID=UPI002ACAF2D3|nr:ligase-associated DNA damage response DEXH box helicase [Labrys sp. ZIDIC5]MDZ5449452.1 ligase-associated DNA damage response DEXH box helicase [Labrys sp. ZIDIC5]